ncbi:MAG: winged helix-turn-helix domain-containing protein [Alphaproteobacteria bacterium]|nr:MAG: winged helix-turn-helix domain-containing protein [Alphaproteobacteria bacterium]
MTALTSKRGAVVAALRAAPQGLTLRQVAEAVGRSIPAARRHLADLQQEGVVTIGAIPLAARTFRLPDTTPALSPQLLPVYEAAARLPQPLRRAGGRHTCDQW